MYRLPAEEWQTMCRHRRGGTGNAGVRGSRLPEANDASSAANWRGGL